MRSQLLNRKCRKALARTYAHDRAAEHLLQELSSALALKIGLAQTTDDNPFRAQFRYRLRKRLRVATS